MSESGEIVDSKAPAPQAPQPSPLQESTGYLYLSVSDLQRLQAGEVVDIKPMSHITNRQLLNIVGRWPQ